MKIEDVIRGKGTTVITASPDGTVADLVSLLAEHRIGAVVVSSDGLHIEGIVSERDIVRALAERGADALRVSVREIMTSDVRTATPDDALEETAHTMTVHRVRHIPITVDGELRAIVSIGDIVKNRIDQLTDERNHLLGYLHT
jgi:CBS domain-containing protein